jgi:glutathione S-transferase
MRLLYSPTSPYARKVRAVAIEMGVSDRIELTLANPLGDDAHELRRLHPLGKVPALLLPDGRVIVDSPVICEHLNALSPEPQLIPMEADARLDTLTRQAIADGVADAAFNLVMEARRPAAQRSPDWTDRWTGAIQRSAVVLGERLAPGRFDLGDIATAVSLLYLDFRLPELGWRIASPALASWADQVSRRPSLAGTAPPAA